MPSNQTVLSVELLNAIRAEASANYQASIQEATQDNIAEVGAQITAYDPKFNEFTGLLAKIAKTVTIKRFYQNPLAVFKKEKLETANMIEEYFIRKIKSQLQDPDGADHHAPKRPSFSITYHKENRNETYKTTTSFKQIRNAFRSRDGVESLMNEIVSAMLSDAQIDEFMIMSELIKRATDGSFTVLVDNPLASEQNAKNLMKAIRTASNAFERPSSLYHNATKIVGLDTVKDTDILTFTPKRNQVLFIRTDVEAQVDVEVLAHAFNQGKTDSQVTRIITLDDLGEDVVAILADEDMLVIHDTFNEMLTEINASGAFTNYYQHIDQLLAISPYANIAVFKVASGVLPLTMEQPLTFSLEAVTNNKVSTNDEVAILYGGAIQKAQEAIVYGGGGALCDIYVDGVKIIDGESISYNDPIMEITDQLNLGYTTFLAIAGNELANALTVGLHLIKMVVYSN